jgi:hypothetical protein
MIIDGLPDQLKLPFYLWTRAAAGSLIGRLPKTGYVAPDDGVSWRRVTRTLQVTAETRELQQAGL